MARTHDTSGEWMLKKADAISNFVAAQRNRTQRTATKSAWGVAAQQLSAESEILGKQLQQLLQQTSARNPDLSADVAELLEQHSAAAAEQQLERLQLLAQVQDLSGLVHSIRCYGLQAAEQQLPCDTLVTLKQELRWLAQDIDSQLLQLAAQSEQLAAEVAADTKAALAGDGAIDEDRTGSTDAASAEERGIAANNSSSRAASDSSDGDSSAAAAGALAASPAPESSTVLQQQQHAELQQLLAQHLLAPDRLKQQVQEAYAGLVQQHQQQVQQLSAQHGGASSSCCGGWPADNHALFVRLRQLAYNTAGSAGARSSSSRGCSRSAVLDRLCLMMPGKSKKQLQEHDIWYTAACLQQRRTSDLAAAWQRQQAAFLADSAKMLGEAAAAAEAGAEAAAARLAWEAAGGVLAGQLAGMQQAKQQEQQELAAAQEAASNAAAAQAAVAQAAWQQQHDAKKAQVQQYKQLLAEQLAQAQEAEEQAAAEAATALHAAIEAQRPLVDARQADCLGKRQEQLQQHQQRQVQPAERQARLDAIAAALAPHVASDPARLLQPTAASAAAVGEVAAAAAFKPVHGYTTAQVVADPRFRVVEALGSAGLLSGAAKGYVQRVVAAVQPTTVSRPDNYTSSQLQAAARRLA